MNPELIAAEIVDKLPELARDSKLNAHEFIAGKLRAAMTEESRMKSNGMSSMADRMVRLAMSNHTPEELALGYLRYEAIRRPVLQRSGSETRRQKRMNTNETQSPGSLHPVVQPTRPWTHEQETEEMLRDCGRPEIRTCVECGENAPETGHICDECREQNGLL